MKNCIVTISVMTYFRLAGMVREAAPSNQILDRDTFGDAFRKYYNCQDFYRSGIFEPDGHSTMKIIFANAEDALWFRLKCL